MNGEYMPPEAFKLRKSEEDKAADTWAAGIILYKMIYGKHPFERNGEVTSESITNEPLKFNQKVVLSNECKEVLQCMLERSPLKRLPLSKIATFKWFEQSDSELKASIQELLDARNKLIQRKEYLQRKAAMRGNKFLNDEGKVVVMNRNLNKDLREDML